MELVKLHIGQFCAGLRRQGDAIAGGDSGICGVGVDLACAARCDEYRTCSEPDAGPCGAAALGSRGELGGLGAGQVGPDHAAIGDHEAGDAGPLGEADALVDAGKGHKRAADLGAGGIAVSVQDAGQGMGALARAQKWAAPAITFAVRYAIEIRAPLDELRNAQRAFADERFGRGAIDQAVACVHRVFQVQGDVLGRPPWLRQCRPARNACSIRRGTLW